MSTPETQPSLWERVKDRPGALGEDRQAALVHVRAMARSTALRSREEAVGFLAGVGDPEARELLLMMVLAESNYGLTERLVTLMSAQGDAVDAAKALHVAQVHAGKASSFAFRRIARAIGERLGIPDGQMKGALSAAELELFLGRLGTPASPAKTSGGHAPVLAPVPAAPRARLHPALAVVLIAALVIAAATLALGPRVTELLDQAGERTVTIAPQALASSAAPASFTHAKVTWSGVIENLVALTRTLYIKTGDGAHVIAVFDGALPDLRVGDPVRFTGRITGRSRFGPIHLRGLTVERAREN